MLLFGRGALYWADHYGSHTIKTKKMHKNLVLCRLLLLLRGITLTQEQTRRQQRVCLIYLAETAVMCNIGAVMCTAVGNSVVVRFIVYTMKLEEVMCLHTVQDMLIYTPC